MAAGVPHTCGGKEQQARVLRSWAAEVPPSKKLSEPGRNLGAGPKTNADDTAPDFGKFIAGLESDKLAKTAEIFLLWWPKIGDSPNYSLTSAHPLPERAGQEPARLMDEGPRSR